MKMIVVKNIRWKLIEKPVSKEYQKRLARAIKKLIFELNINSDIAVK